MNCWHWASASTATPVPLLQRFLRYQRILMGHQQAVLSIMQVLLACCCISVVTLVRICRLRFTNVLNILLHQPNNTNRLSSILAITSKELWSVVLFLNLRTNSIWTVILTLILLVCGNTKIVTIHTAFEVEPAM